LKKLFSWKFPFLQVALDLMPGMRDDDAIMNHHVIWEGRSHWTKGSSNLNSPAKKLSILLKMLMV
jgi:hypothetical protein